MQVAQKYPRAKTQARLQLGYEVNEATYGCSEGFVREPVRDALRELIDAAANYGSTYFVEFAPRNLATDDQGNLVLLDVMFDAAQLFKLRTKGLHERLPIVERSVDEPSIVEQSSPAGDSDIGPAEPDVCGTEGTVDEAGLTLAWVAQPTNEKTGPIPTAYVIDADPNVADPGAGSRASCAAIGCALLGEGCYAHSGTPRMGVASLVRSLVEGADKSLERALANRDPSATAARMTALGDVAATPALVMIAKRAARRIAQEGLGLIGYTHGWRLEQAAGLRSTFRASCNTLNEVDEALAAGWKATTVLPYDVDPRSRDVVTPGGAKVKICPALVPPAEGRARVTCNTCRLCTTSSPIRVIGFPAHGRQELAATELIADAAVHRLLLVDGKPRTTPLTPEEQADYIADRIGGMRKRREEQRKARRRAKAAEARKAKKAAKAAETTEALRAPARIPHSRVQSLLFDKAVFPTLASAKAWAKSHKFKVGRAFDEENYWHLRQMEPVAALPHTFGTKQLREGVLARFAVPVTAPGASKRAKRRGSAAR